MQKRVGIFSLFALLTIGFVSAQGLGDFSFSTLLSSIDPTLATLSILFVIFFAVIFFSTSKMFKENRAVAAIISIAVSLLAVYWINKSTDLNNLVLGLGISNDVLYTILPFAAIGAMILFASIKTKSGNRLGLGAVIMVLGVMIIGASFTDLVYEKGIAIVIGIVFALVGFYVVMRRRKKKALGPTPPGASPNISHNNYTYNTAHNYYNQVQKEKEEEAVKERGREKEIKLLENKGQADANRIRQDEIRREQQQKQLINQERNEQRQIEQKETSLISTDINSLMRSYNALQQTYNEIYSRNPSDTQLTTLMDDMIRIRDEMIRIKKGQR